jgi:myo-inositol-1(or 4)-monophosphatase
MSTSSSDPILAVAVRAARRAASVVVDASRDLKRLPSFSHEHADIVASATSDAHGAIRASLSAAYPDHAIVGDEKPADAPRDSPFRWFVEAIDGTANFVHGFPYYAVSIALANNRDLTHAVVLDPVRDELFTAVHGKGAQLNGAPVRISACTRLEDALVGTTFPSRKSPRLAAYVPVLNALMARCGGVRRGGSAALDLAYLAAGRLDAFFVLGQQPRDLAAGALIVKEAGGRVGDLTGGDDFLRGSEVIAAAPGVFNPLREAILAARSP